MAQYAGRRSPVWFLSLGGPHFLRIYSFFLPYPVHFWDFDEWRETISKGENEKKKPMGNGLFPHKRMELLYPSAPLFPPSFTAGLPFSAPHSQGN